MIVPKLVSTLTRQPRFHSPVGHSLTVTLPALVLMLIGGSPCANAEPENFGSTSTAMSRQITIGTGNPAGMYFVVGNAICRIVERWSAALPSENGKKGPIDCAAVSTSGSLSNLKNLRTKRLGFGLVQSDWQYHAYFGTDQFQNKPINKLRSIVSLHAEAFQLLIGRDTAGEGFHALDGRSVNVGPPGSGGRATFEVILKAMKKDLTWFSAALSLSTANASDALCDGDVDIVSYMMGFPHKQVQKVLSNCQARLLSLDYAQIENLTAIYPFYSGITLESGTYEGYEEDVATIGVLSTFVTTEDTDEDLVYDITKAIFENLDTLRAGHPVLAYLNLQDMVRVGLSAPTHRGAQRYINDQGWWWQAPLIPQDSLTDQDVGTN